MTIVIRMLWSCCFFFQAMEHYQHEARAMSMSLDRALSQISERMRHQEPKTPADMLHLQRQLRESVINSTETVIRQGNFVSKNINYVIYFKIGPLIFTSSAYLCQFWYFPFAFA